MSHRLTSLLATSLTCCGTTLWLAATTAVGYPLEPDGHPRPEPTANPKHQVETGSAIEPLSLTSANASKFASPSILRLGSRGQQVLEIQTVLAALGYDVAADGRYGVQTQAAVMEFQRQTGLPVDGQIGTLTLTKLRQAISPTAATPDRTRFMAAALPVVATAPAPTTPADPGVTPPVEPSSAAPANAGDATAAPAPESAVASPAPSSSIATEPSQTANANSSDTAPPSDATEAPTAEAPPQQANTGLLWVIGLVMLAAMGGIGWYGFQLRRPKSIKRPAGSRRSSTTPRQDEGKSAPAERSPWDDEDEDDDPPESPASQKTVEVSNETSMQVMRSNNHGNHSTSSFLASPSQSEVTRLARVDICEELIGDLHHSDVVKRRKAIWDLGQQGDSRAVQPLVDLLIDSDSHQRSLILAAISEIGIRTLKPINHALMYTLEDDNADVRKNAIRDVTRIYDMISQISQVLRHAADDADEEVRDTARWALTQLNRIRSTPEIDPAASLPGPNTVIPEALPDNSNSP